MSWCCRSIGCGINRSIYRVGIEKGYYFCEVLVKRLSLRSLEGEDFKFLVVLSIEKIIVFF